MMKVLTKDSACQTTEYNIPHNTHASTLPFQHSCFPEPSNSNSARIYNRNMEAAPTDTGSTISNNKKRRKSKDVDSKNFLTPRIRKEGSETQRDLVDLKLPDITLREGVGAERQSRGDLPTSSRFVPNQKALFRMKGLKYEEAYSHSRSKPETNMCSSDIELDKSLKLYRKKKALHPSSGGGSEVGNDLKLPCIHPNLDTSRDDSEVASARTSLCSRCGLQETAVGRQNTRDPDFMDDLQEQEESAQGNEELQKHINQVLEDYLETPGVKHRQRQLVRKLGDVVSPLRMIELLKAREPLKMENCFNYYP